MKTTVTELRKIVRKVIQEHVSDERRNNSRFFNESRFSDYDAKINRAKPYIASDASLYYSL